MKIVALLPMKANSQRVSGKNFRELNGKPLFGWILDTLLSLDEISEVVINTDARGILAEKGLAERNRVLIRDRKPELCGDTVSMNKVLADDVAAVDADLYLMTHTTNPLLRADTIRQAIKAFNEAGGRHDSLFSVNRFQTRFYDTSCNPVNHDPDNLIPTQELVPWFEENSCLYLFTRSSFKATGARIGESPMMFETPKIESVDIDEPEDWLMAEAVSKYISGQSS